MLSQQNSSREKLVEQLKSVKDRPVKAWKCYVCKTLLPYKASHCTREKHEIKRVLSRMYYFNCSNCGRFMNTVGDPAPRMPCRGCGSCGYTPATLYQVRQPRVRREGVGR
jgi:hypothetical protein